MGIQTMFRIPAELEIDEVRRCREHGGRAPTGFLDFSSSSNPLGAPDFLKEAVDEAVKLGIYTRYPDFEYVDLKEALALFYGVDRDGVVPLNGAAEALNLLLLCTRPAELLVVEPTFGEHRCLSKLAGVNYSPIPYREVGRTFEFPVDELTRAIKVGPDRLKLVLLSNPNNPTGTCAEPSLVEEVLSTSSSVLVVVDEAYAEISPTCGQVLELTSSYENLVVVRSLTKSLGILGLRVGFIYTSNARLSKVLDMCRQPWNVNSVAYYALSKVLRDRAGDVREFLRKSAELVEVEREFLSKGLSELGISVYESRAPFILVKHAKVRAGEMLKMLLNYRIVVRDASSFPYLTEYHVRLSVRKREENKYLLYVYRELGIG